MPIRKGKYEGYKPYVFSCESTKKMSEEVVKGFQELDKLPNNPSQPQNPLLQAVYARQERAAEAECKRKKQQPNAEEETFNFELFNQEITSCEGWINIDDNPSYFQNLISEHDNSLHYLRNKNQDSGSNDMDVDQTHTDKDTIDEYEGNRNIENEMDDSDLKILAGKIRDTKQNKLSQEIKENIMKLTEVKKICLLKLVSDSEDCIISLCRTVADEMETRDQSLFAALICTNLLVHKAKKEKFEGDLYIAIGRLLESVPYVVGTYLLLPMLLNGGDSQKQASLLIASCEAPTLRSSVFRSWITEKSHHNFTDLDFELLKMFLKTPVRDADSVRNICLLFSQIGESYSTNMNFAQFVLIFIKSHHNLIGEDAKKHLSSTVSFNKTSCAKILEREIAKIK